MTFFRLHIVADEEHGERGFEIMDKYATTPDAQEKCVRIVKEATLMRRLYLDGLYNKYLVPGATRMAAE